ncbi:hypothetical protein [Sphingobium lignivorans]|uniref:Deoxynucleotide monophosphate kinase n=1 Tax=Sphingobium lignivorans TaxID=2735886 RepID=A0ABR6NH51_9SPHN|nr:hypothetical protein [Sphingobium lignivorans]MBB5985957.1 hypothetical protein [Sphingobium lignivorans]
MTRGPRLVALCATAMGSGKTTFANRLVERHGFKRIAFATPLKQMTEGLLESLDILPLEEIRDRVYGDRKEEPIPDLHRLGGRPLDIDRAVNMAIEGLLDALGMTAAEVVERMYGAGRSDIVPGVLFATIEISRLFRVFLHRHVFGPAPITCRQLQQRIGTEFGREMIRQSLWSDITMAAAQRLRDEGHHVVIDDMRFPNELAAVIYHGGEPWRIVRPGAQVTSGHASEGQLDAVRMDEFYNTSRLSDLLVAVDTWVSTF